MVLFPWTLKQRGLWIMVFFIFLIIGGCLLISRMFYEAFLNKVIKRELFFSDFPDSFGQVSIFFISDIHRRVISDKIIADVLGKVDVVVIGGDLTEKGVPMKRVKENIEKLKKLGPVYFVWGNNDYEVDYRKLDFTLLENGVKILYNTSVTFESEVGEKICLLGVDDLNQNLDRIDLALLDADKEGFKILASHYPQIVEKIGQEHNIRLTLSGHTHGGQIHLLGYSPYERGTTKTLSNTTLLISNGYGTTALPLRLGAPAECHLITLKKG
jgi:uncharacterized protein